MRKGLLAACFVLLTGCSQIEKLTIAGMTPQKFLEGMPYITLTIGKSSFILIQPSSTLMVYGLGILTTILGILFLRNHRGQASRKWWGIGMVLWGIGAIVAGSSYQAFGYELKCATRSLCLSTSWAEILYLWITIFSMNALLVAMTYRMHKKTQRKNIRFYALISCMLYSAWLLTGILTSNSFMISYEALLLFLLPTIVLYFVVLLHQKSAVDRTMKLTWILFLGVNVAYFMWMFAGIAAPLYQNLGFWLNENDILHLFLILWMVWQYRKVYPLLADEPLEP
ncbi:MAG: hypothetical protein WBL80_07520 [Erysipelotrichaceae bacterium]